MKTPPTDIPVQMGTHPEATAAAAGPVKATRAILAPADFSTRFQTSLRTLWLIAAGVLGNRSDADDVLQEAAMIGLGKIRDFDPATSFAAWMGGIVRNVARNHLRKRIRRSTAPTDPATLDQSATAAAPAPTLSFDRSGALDPDQSAFDDRLTKALASLDETARACLLLRTLSNLPYREISVVLGIPEGTAMSHVHRSRHALRSLLSQSA